MNEVNLWLNLGRDSISSYEASDDVENVQLLMNLEDSMFFVSLLADDAIGASAIYKDTARNAMALLSVRVVPEYRNRVTSHIIKSSLPFFRTVAIREVDCLVSSAKEDSLPFPIQNTLYSWSEQFLSEHGFSETGFVKIQTFKISKSFPEQISQWDQTPMSKEAQKGLFWKIDVKERQDYSHFWMGIDLCGAAGRLYTISKDEHCVAVVGAILYQDQLIIMAMMHDVSEIDDSSFASNLFALAQESGAHSISILNLENTRSSFFDHITSIYGEPVKVTTLKLMRKNL
ncbi:MAG: hypothetical protein P1Q69_09910 [Candidatus Thorarchaeota archaeon]|nr:hypothetical protein [Candidatus Thorarchaeota archaeon]